MKRRLKQFKHDILIYRIFCIWTHLMLGVGKACASHRRPIKLFSRHDILFKPSPVILGAVLPVGSGNITQLLISSIYTKFTGLNVKLN